MNSQCETIVERYLSHITSQFDTYTYEDNVCRITTPFLRPDGEHIEFYVSTDEKKSLTISDEGRTIEWLFSSGMDVDRNKPRYNRIIQLAKRYNIIFSNNTFSVVLNDETIGYDIHRFLTAIQAISQLTLLRRQRAQITFKDEITTYLIESQQNPHINYRIAGKSTEHTVDFYINSQRNWLIEALPASTLSSAKDEVHKVSFKWLDIRAGGSDFTQVVVLDDSSDNWETIWSRPQILSPLQNYSDRIIRWSQRVQLIR